VRQLKAKYEREVRKITATEKDNFRQQHLIKRARYRFFKNYEHQLDAAPFGACHLRHPEIAKVVKDKLHQYDGEYYDLLAYSIMPNHCHAVFDFGRQVVDVQDSLLSTSSLSLEYRPLHDVMRLIKGGSAREINKFIGNTGKPFWQKDSYDHFVRDQRSLGNVVAYTLQNAAAAGLVDDWQEWPNVWSRM